MNIFDIVIIFTILLAGAVGLKRGVLKELVMLIGTILVYFLSFQLKNPLANFMMRWFPFFDFIGKIKGVTVLNVVLYQVLAFAIIASILFAIFHIIVKTTGIIQKLIDLTLILTLPSKILGFFVGLISGYIYVFIALVLFAIPLGGVELFTNSNMVNKILVDSPILSNSLGGFKDAVRDIYQVTGKVVTTDKVDTNQLNLSVMDILLKYKVVTTDDMAHLLEQTDKLDDINGLAAVIYHYK